MQTPVFEAIGKILAEVRQELTERHQADLKAAIDDILTQIKCARDELTEAHREALQDAIRLLEDQIFEARTELALMLDQRDRSDHKAALEQVGALVDKAGKLESDVTRLAQALEDFPTPEKGDPGIDGQDRILVHPVELQAGREYPKNTTGTHGGGLWISKGHATGSPEDDPHAWDCVLDGYTSMVVELQEDHTYKLTVRMGSGRVIEDTFHIPYPEHLGLYKADTAYKAGNIVTKGTAFWQAIEDTDKAPPGNGWQQILVAPRGKQGPPGKSIKGEPGKPGRNGRDAELPDGFIQDLTDLANSTKRFQDGRDEAEAITSFRGYFDSRETYRAGDVINHEGALLLCVRGGQFDRIALDPTAWELMLDFPKRPERVTPPYMLWQGEWKPGEYNPGDTVLDGAWTMTCLSITSDRPAPQAVGQPVWISALGDTPTWSIATPTDSTVFQGTRYTFGTGGFVTAVRVWAAQADPDIKYSLWMIADPLGTRQPTQLLGEFSASSTGWIEIQAGQRVVRAGDVFDVVLTTSNQSSSAQFTGNWDYLNPNNTAIPAAGQISHGAKSQDLFNISKEDNLGADRSVDLATLDVGSHIEIAGIKWTIQQLVDEGAYLAFLVTPEITLDAEGDFFVTFTTYDPQPVNVPSMTDHYQAVAGVSGIYSLDDPEAMVEDDNAYGTDLQVNDAWVSEHWDSILASGADAAGNIAAIDSIPPPETDYVQVETTGAAWTEAHRRTLLAGQVISGQASVNARQLDGDGIYSTELELLADENTIYQQEVGRIGTAGPDVRMIEDGPDVVIQVKGKHNQAWRFHSLVTWRAVT